MSRDHDHQPPTALDTQAAAVALGTSPSHVRVLGHRGLLRRLPGTDGARRALWLLEDVERLAQQPPGLGDHDV